MKSSLLIAAAVCAFASTASAETLWTTTFNGSNNTNNASRTLINTSSAGFADSLTATASLTRSSGTGNFFLTGTGNDFTNYNPNQNVDSVAGANWSSVFDFNGGTQSINLNSVSFTILRFNSSGAVVSPDVNVRNVFISAEYTLNGGANWSSIGSTQTVNLTPSDTTTPLMTVGFNFGAPASVNLASNDFQIRYTVLNDNANVGAFTGIKSISFDGSVAPIPEPSTYGLMGAGALAAVAVVRRRRKQAAKVA